MISIPQALRTCTICHESLPLSEFYVKIKKTGRLYSWCKVCHNTRTLRDHDVRLGVIEKPIVTKPDPNPRQCRFCGLSEPEVKIRKNRRVCVKCEILNGSKESQVRRQEKYRKTHREEIQTRAKERYETDPRYGPGKQQIWRADNPERSKAMTYRYRESHPDFNTINVGRRRARLLRIEGYHTVEEWAALKALYGYRCLKCNRQEPEIQLTEDHVIPLTKPGTTNYISNIQPLCQSCNSSKNRKHIDYRPLEHRPSPENQKPSDESESL